MSSHTDAVELVRRERLGLIPKSLRDHPRIKAAGAQLFVSVYDPSKADRSLAETLLEDTTNQAIVLLLDEAVGHVAQDVASACFVAEVEFFSHPKSNYKNYFASKLTKVLKTLLNFLDIIEDGANAQVMLLPFRNFNAKQLRDLKELCRKETQSDNFINQVVSLIEALKGRRRPHRKSNYPEQYFADDDEKLFKYGLERHAVLATGTPHNSICVLTGNFRFGKRIAIDRHYNVTKEHGKGTQIGGNFPDCHDDIHVITTRTHLNLFCNDYQA